MNREWYTRRWAQVSLHVLFWTLFFTLPYIMRPVLNNERAADKPHDETAFFTILLVNNLLRLLLFYANAFWLVPKLIYRKRIFQYLLIVTGSFLLMLLIDRFTVSQFFPGRLDHQARNFTVFNLFPFIFIIIASTAYRVIRDLVKNFQRQKEKENENLKTELSLLRSQVSPHFMFNILNNMVALARKKSDLLEPSLIKLSSLLRYMLYETDQKVTLSSEIDYLKSYIDLQSQRFGKKLPIHTSFEPGDKDYLLEPMLLIPFVENAFKHGTGLIEDPAIQIELHAHNGLLKLDVKNRYNPSSTEIRDDASGIGLGNVQRRLGLLYPNQHRLQLSQDNGWFLISLELKLH